jgi:4-aminobutyrate aminotransferase-like enzyme
LQQNAKDVGTYLREQIRSLAAPIIADVRGAGFFIGVEIVSNNPSVSDAELTAGIVNGLRDRRVLISASGPRANVLKIRPPLVFSKDNADQLVKELRATVAALQ